MYSGFPPLNVRVFSFKIIFCYCCLFAKLCPVLCSPHGLQPTRFLCPWDFPGKNTGVDCHFLLQGIFPTQGSNLCLLHQQVGSSLLSYQGNQNNQHILKVFFIPDSQKQRVWSYQKPLPVDMLRVEQKGPTVTQSFFTLILDIFITFIFPSISSFCKEALKNWYKH